jgi:enoyl-CoA hydratase
MDLKTLLYAASDGIALVTINRPEKLNALNSQVLADLRTIFEQIKMDPAVRVVIVTGAGEKAFVAGADITELAVLDPGTGKRFAEDGQGVFTLIETMGKPVIAAVNGYALGGGCELALACHLRIAAENAKFGQPEVNLGIIPGYGGTQRLTRLVGSGRAMEMILTGDQIDAVEAYRIGLANKVVPSASLLDAARTIAGKILARGPFAVHYALRAVHMANELSLTEGLALESALFGQCCGTEDFKEGTSAFLEKRNPTFRGM